MQKKIIFFILCIVMFFNCYKTEVSSSDMPGYEENNPDNILNGLVEEDGIYYYYENGELIKNKWVTSDGKKYYLYENGQAATGIIIIDGNFYCFNTNGKYNKPKTVKIRKAAKYKKPFDNLKKFIGKPNKKKYYTSCYGNGKDGVLSYDNFTIYTFKPDKGKEIFMGAE